MELQRWLFFPQYLATVLGSFRAQISTGVPMTIRIALVGFYHETNTFAVTTTPFELFESYQYVEGPLLIDRYRGTGTELGGAIREIDRRGWVPVPVLFASAIPSGVITGACFASIRAKILAGFEQIGTFDGVVAVLHGAAVSEGIPDADAAVLVLIRKIVGPDCPVAATTDFHANISLGMVTATDVIVGYDTYPHTDMAARGAEAVTILALLLSGERLQKAYRKLPLLTVPQCQSTDDEPMRTIGAFLGEVEARAGIVTATIALGFPYADSEELGATVLVYGDSRATAAASDLAQAIWKLRHSFIPKLLPTSAILRLVDSTAVTPVVLVDPADNVGGGSAGDGTAVLVELVRGDAQGAVIVICDRVAAAQAAAVGEGQIFSGLVGARTDWAHGSPLMVEGTVTYVRETNFTHSGSYMTGTVTQMGLTAIVEIGGVKVVLTSLRTMPFDIEQLRSVGIEPASCRVIVVKSAIAWRAAYGAVAQSQFTIDTPGICPSNLERLAYRCRPSPIFPLEATAGYCDKEKRQLVAST